MNAVNFIDGLDGLAAGIVGIGAVAFFAYYYTLTHRLGLVNQMEPALVSILLAGVCIGFLPHNFYPARIFMGDTGSMLIGLMLAYAPISSLALLDPASLTDTAAYAAGTVNRYGAFIPLLVPAAILLIPYADLLMAVVRRTRAGQSVFAPDKKHLQHRLLAIGHSHRTSVLIMYLWAALFSGSVIWLSIVRTPLIVLAILTVAAIVALLLVTMPRLRPWSRVSAEGAADVARRTAPVRVRVQAEAAREPTAVTAAPESAWRKAEAPQAAGKGARGNGASSSDAADKGAAGRRETGNGSKPGNPDPVNGVPGAGNVRGGRSWETVRGGPPWESVWGGPPWKAAGAPSGEAGAALPWEATQALTGPDDPGATGPIPQGQWATPPESPGSPGSPP
jgi:Glycosyl transferase family 4